ncbi:MAG: bifunctional diaminohydroxyphosphoribosylaminopyrimidine deaminase/5-amino-6-(5-phosphoribosylamino)uracil reductase RibD [Bacteroidota bacterium]
MSTDEVFMQRCFELARLGAGPTSPNPMVGAVIVFKGRIIGEGYHRKHGQAHAEVNAVASLSEQDRKLLPQSTIYVSLEPCSIHGRTPPCVDLIKRERIPRVVISYLDHTEGVNGQGVRRLREAGVDVKLNVLQSKGKRLSSIRNTFVSHQRPYVVLKWAQSADGFLGRHDRPVAISNAVSKRLLHRWRAELDAIMVGTQTAVTDNPRLTNRLYFGSSPLRIVPDFGQRIPSTHHLLADQLPTMVLGPKRFADKEWLQFEEEMSREEWLPKLLSRLYQHKITSLLVEGGASLLQHFIDSACWDEARIFYSPTAIGEGVKAPIWTQTADESHQILNDRLDVFFAS